MDIVTISARVVKILNPCNGYYRFQLKECGRENPFQAIVNGELLFEIGEIVELSGVWIYIMNQELSEGALAFLIMID